MSTTAPTTATDLATLENELNAMILDGKIMEAFERFYADDCTLQEGAEAPIVGKDANRDREQTFVGGLTELRAARLEDVAVGDDVTMSVWHFDYTHGEWGSHTYDQVAVRKWRDGKIVSERFYKVV